MTVRKNTIRLLTVLFSIVMLFAMPMELSFAAVKKPARVKISSVKVNGLKITVKWKKAKNAKKYQVYMKVGSGTWKLKKTFAKLAFSVTGKYGKTYSFKVRGISGKKRGSFSAVKKITLPKKEQPEKPEEPEEPEHEKTPLEIAADKVMDQILALPKKEEITEADSETIAAARKAYTRLPDSAKAFVKEEVLAVLEAAERRLMELPAEKTAAMIEKLPKPEKISENSMYKVQEAVAAYNDLTDEQKLLIPDETYDKLRLAVFRLQELLTRQENREKANAVSARIMEYWDIDKVSFADKKDIEDIREAYEALTDEQKEFVDKEYTLAVLEAAEAKFAEMYVAAEECMVKWPKITLDGTEYYKAI